MNFLDVGTVILSQWVTDSLCLLVLVFLWLQNRKRFAGTFFWVADFGFQTLAIFLILLRGSVQNWLSIGFPDILVVAGALLGYIGLERFAGKRSSQVPNYVFLAVFALANSYYAFIRNDLNTRDILVSLGLFVICLQCIGLISHRVSRAERRKILWVGVVYGLFCLVSLVRILGNLAVPQQGNNFFQSDVFDTLTLLCYQILLISLTFSLVILVNNHLISAAQSQEEKFTKVFHLSPFAILLTQVSDGRVYEVNDGFVKMTGYSWAEIVGKTLLELHLWDTEEGYLDMIKEVSQGKPVVEREFGFCKKSGEIRLGLVSAEGITVDDLPWILFTINDITERKQAAKKIDSLTKFPSENPNPTLRLDREGIILYANVTSQALLEDWGTAVEQPAPKFWRSLVTEVLEQQTMQTIEIKSAGRIYSFFAVPIMEFEYVNLYGRDITIHKQAEEMIQRDHRILQEIVDNTPALIYMLDLEGRFLLVNRRMEEVNGLAPGEIIGKTREALLPAPVAAQRHDIDLEVIRAREQVTFVSEKAQPEGTITYLSTMFPIIDQTGQVYAIGGVSTDISEQVQIGKELEREKAELTRSNAELEMFAYVASHDLQEPLRMVSSFMQLLERRYKGKLDKDADEFIGFAVDGSMRMQHLINDLLAYSRIGTHPQPFAPTASEAVLYQAMENLRVAIQESDARITHDPLPEVMGDELQLVQLFQNLIGNAIKFRAEQAPCVHIAVESKESEWVFAVSDNGIGLDPQYAERIFIIFQRLNSREKYPGTGMGLAMCKKIVQRHGGRIWVESTLGKGATFYFSLPKMETSEHGNENKQTN